MLSNDGQGEVNELRDIGVFATFKKAHGGLALAKATAGISVTTGCRDDFDGTDIEIGVGIGEVGGSFGGLADPDSNSRSLSLEVGPQLGFEASLTQTFSLTVGDLARLVAFLLHGNGGEIIGSNCECKSR